MVVAPGTVVFQERVPQSEQFSLPLRPEDGDARHTLVLDLDETLIHTSFESSAMPTDDNVLKVVLKGYSRISIGFGP